MFNKTNSILLVAMAFATLASSSFARGVTVIQGSGSAQAINAYQFAGNGSVRVGDLQTSESSLATLLSLAPGPGGKLVGTSTHTIVLGAAGSITTSDELMLVPVNPYGLFEMSIRSQIIGGTGDFAGASGRLSFNGFANLATGEVVWQVHGQIE